MGKNCESKDVPPCCVIIRNPTNVDVVDITIAPGIDPLLMVCHLAVQSKIDVIDKTWHLIIITNSRQ